MSDITPSLFKVIKLWWLGKKLWAAGNRCSSHIWTIARAESKEIILKRKLKQAASDYWSHYSGIDKRCK